MSKFYKSFLNFRAKLFVTFDKTQSLIPINKIFTEVL